jgi:hypothetical protein
VGAVLKGDWKRSIAMKLLFALLIVALSSGGASAATSNDTVPLDFPNDLISTSDEVVFDVEPPMWAVILDEDDFDEGYED